MQARLQRGWAAFLAWGAGLALAGFWLLAGRPLFAGAPGKGATTAYPLVVTVGSGSGDFPAGALVHIWADPPHPGEVFDRWTGDVAALIDRAAPHTTLVMPRSKVSVEALFKGAPGCSPVTETVRGVGATWCLPSGHRAVILVFHSSREGSGAAIFRSAEVRIFAAEAAAAGFGLVAVDAADRDKKLWHFMPAADERGAGGGAAGGGGHDSGGERGAGHGDGRHGDLDNVQAVVADLARRHEIGSGEPLYGLGIAHGGAFAMHAARALRLRAVAVFGAPEKLPRDYATPTLWLTTQTAVDRAPRALAEFTQLEARQVAAKVEINEASPVYPLRFWRIPGITPEESRAIHQLLADRGLLDAHDFLKDDPETSGWELSLPPRLAKMRFLLREQLDICYAVPRFYSDRDHRLLEFFHDHS